MHGAQQARSVAGARGPDLPPAPPPQLWAGGHIWLRNGVYFWPTTGAAALKRRGSPDPDTRAAVRGSAYVPRN